MITPKEIQEQCLRWWNDFLLSISLETSYFPKEITRIGKVTSKDILSNLSNHQSSIALLQAHSKDAKKHSYSLIFEERTFEKIGKQKVPQKIIIETIEDYLRITGKEKEYQLFLKNQSLILHEIPILHDWIKKGLTQLIEHTTWEDTLKVCQYFLKNPRPLLYIRQLPIDVHTKYIIENMTIIQSLLDYLIPDYININERIFEKRFNLKYSEPLIRVRFLDTKISPLKMITDLSLTLTEFNIIAPHCENIFVTENKINFLTLPFIPNTIALWSGGGFNVSYLKDINWIQGKRFYYWGDIDAHGFQILNQFRTYFPNTIAVMMDEETLLSYKYGSGKPTGSQNLQKLTPEELKLYDHLVKDNLRLEQEKILQTFADEKIKQIFSLV